MAWGAHAPSLMAVGAPADRFFRLIYNSYWSIQAQHPCKARIRVLTLPEDGTTNMNVTQQKDRL